MRRLRAGGPRIDTAAEIAYRHMTHFLRGVNPDLASQWIATLEAYRAQTEAKSFVAALAGLLAAAQPDRETPKAITKDRAARMAWDLLEPYMSHGLAVAAWEDGRMVVAARDVRDVRDVMKALDATR